MPLHTTSREFVRGVHNQKTLKALANASPGLRFGNPGDKATISQ
jgi:hypothetical protein